MPRGKKTTTAVNKTEQTPKVDSVKVTENTTKATTAKTKVAPKPSLRRVPLDVLVPVASNCVSPLIYVSKRQNGYKVEWENYGDVDYMQVSELIAMRGSARKFFTNNWIVINDDEYTAEEVYNTIGVSKLYEDVVTPETIIALLNKPIPQIRSAMSKMSDGLKRTVYEYTVKLKNGGEFDSIKKFELIKDIAGYGDVE